MTEEDRLRHLLRGLCPSTMEKMIIANPSNCGEFLQTLQRIDQVALMAPRILGAVKLPNAENAAVDHDCPCDAQRS